MQQHEFHRRAQTNIQLYAQLLAAGFGSDDVRRARDAYALATKLFAGQFRPEGRPFVCHVVGVASILAMVKAPVATIIGGLLHSAYSHGDYGLGPGQVTPAARAWLRTAVGPQTEGLLASYASHRWNKVTVLGLLANPVALDADVRTVAVIRLADTVEDALDLGLELSMKESNPNRDVAGEDLEQLANALGYPELAAAYQRALDSPGVGPDTMALRSHHAGSYMVCPSSWREKMVPRAARLMRRVRVRR